MNTGNTALSLPTRPLGVALRRSLNGCFVDFHLLPDLLRKAQRLDGRQQTQECWADYLSRSGFDGTYQTLDEAADAKGIAEDAWRLANLVGLLTSDGLTGAGRKLLAGNDDLTEVLARGLRKHLVGQEGTAIVDLLVAGVATLAASSHPWARFCPGLLTIEMSAIVHWACVNVRKCQRLMNDLVSWRDAAMHRHGAPDPDRSKEENARIHYEALAGFYLSHAWLAERVRMPVGEELALAKLLEFAGFVKVELACKNVTCLVPAE